MKKITDKDLEGKDVTFCIKEPSRKIYDKSSIAYNKALRNALDEGAMLRKKLIQYHKDQGIWNEKKEKDKDKLVETIRVLSVNLQKGGIPLKEAKDLALQIRKKRNELRELVAEKQADDRDCAESVADNARFNYLMTACVVKEDGKPFWNTEEEYDADAHQPWAWRAARSLGDLLYGLQEDYEKNLPENKFLVKYNFADEDLRLKNKDGHLVDSEGRLINDEGRYVSYRDNGEQYYVDVDGNEVDESGELVLDFSPFLDDDGNPIVEEKEVKTTPKRTRRKKQTVEE